MMDERDEGLGVSVAIYAALMAGALALLVGPLLWANGTTVYDNPAPPKYDITSSRPLTAQQRQIPLAQLKHQDIVDQKALAEIQQKAPPKQERTREARSERSERPSRSARAAYAQARDNAAYAQARDNDEPQRQRRGFFGWSLF